MSWLDGHCVSGRNMVRITSPLVVQCAKASVKGRKLAKQLESDNCLALGLFSVEDNYFWVTDEGDVKNKVKSGWLLSTSKIKKIETYFIKPNIIR